MSFDKQLLDEINELRRDPKKYGEKIKSYLSYFDGNVLNLPGRKSGIRTHEGPKAYQEAVNYLSIKKPVEPIQPSKGLFRVAQDYLKRIQRKNADAGSVDVDAIIDKYGEYYGDFINAADYGGQTVEQSIINLIVSDGDKNRRQRESLLNPSYKLLGGATGTHPLFHNVTVIFTCSEFINNKDSEDIGFLDGTPYNKPGNSTKESKPEPEPQSKYQPKYRAQPQTQTQSRYQPQSNAQPEPQTQSKYQPRTRAQPQTQTQSRYQPQSNPQPEPQTQSKYQPRTRAQPQTQTQSRYQPQSNPQPEPQTQSKYQPRTRAQPQTQTQSRYQPQARAQPQTQTQSKYQPRTRTQVETKTETRVIPASEYQPKWSIKKDDAPQKDLKVISEKVSEKITIEGGKKIKETKIVRIMSDGSKQVETFETEE